MGSKFPLMSRFDFLSGPWPWWVTGPLIGLMVPVLLWAGNKEFGISSTFRHLCALAGSKSDYCRYDWRKQGGWQLILALGVVVGGWLAGHYFGGGRVPALSESAREMFGVWGVAAAGYQPEFLHSWSGVWSVRGLICLGLGGFLVGFGTRWANGCTSGHAIMGLSLLNPGSLVATCGFFAGGTLVSWVVVPWLMNR
jgi:uncharacterized membrane protein YedE/YeeE